MNVWLRIFYTIMVYFKKTFCLPLIKTNGFILRQIFKLVFEFPNASVAIGCFLLCENLTYSLQGK